MFSKKNTSAYLTPIQGRNGILPRGPLPLHVRRSAPCVVHPWARARTASSSFGSGSSDARRPPNGMESCSSALGQAQARSKPGSPAAPAIVNPSASQGVPAGPDPSCAVCPCTSRVLPVSRVSTKGGRQPQSSTRLIKVVGTHGAGHRNPSHAESRVSWGCVKRS